MAVKHIEDIINKFVIYNEMNNLKEMEEALQDEMVDPEIVDRLRVMVRPLMENYERWSYMMYLLHKPQRESKEKAYQQRTKKFLAQLAKSNSPRHYWNNPMLLIKILKKKSQRNKFMLN